ncbi:potassium voltage-gated channel subfamily A member 7-like [Actinia tenebrosa]|uniref:Potassium voltage-gated channel subfamily A member 7-like n=1 Tax=Actinia tenebrosa TaxID=6105 RepID=A0A6P8HS75_ACTTE|nr:potassium voltage-gated channel subfamily A member 7-like [Actinia tenebrosa]
MLHLYYGSPAIEALGGGRGFSPLAQRGRTASHGQHLNLFPNLVFKSSKKTKKFAEIRGSSLDLPLSEDNSLVRINVSGKIFDFSRAILEKYPDSLLAKRSRAGTYYDFDRKDYFFDRSRIAFDSIYHFYQTQGQVVFPKDFPEQLVMDEFHFFGLYDYMDPNEKQQFVQPSDIIKEEIVPKYDWQRKMWQLIDHPETNLASKIISIISLLVIALSIVILCVETLPSVRSRRKREGTGFYRSEIFVLESFCIIYFTIEIILRFIASPIKSKFWLKVLNIIDLLAILPYYIILGLENDYSNKSIVALRVFRLARAFRILKVSRYVSGMKVLGQTLREALSDLWMIAFLTVIGTLLFASCVFYFEQIWDPGTKFESIPLSFWWSIVTISTVGYGDMAPKTLAGKLVGSTCAMSGVLLIAPLLPIIYERWQRYYQLDQDGKRIRAGHKLLRDLQKKRCPPTTLEDAVESKKDNSEKQKKRERKASETKERKISETKERSKKPSVSSKSEKDGEAETEERSDDDPVWKHIKRASIKRRESSQNLLRSTSVDNQNPSSRGSLTRKKQVDGKSRKGKDIVANHSQSTAIKREHEKIPENKKDTEELQNTSDKPRGDPVFHICPSEDDVEREKRWDEPGPSNVKY